MSVGNWDNDKNFYENHDSEKDYINEVYLDKVQKLVNNIVNFEHVFEDIVYED